MIRKALQFDNSFLQKRDKDEGMRGKNQLNGLNIKKKSSHQDRDSVFSDALV